MEARVGPGGRGYKRDPYRDTASLTPVPLTIPQGDAFPRSENAPQDRYPPKGNALPRRASGTYDGRQVVPPLQEQAGESIPRLGWGWARRWGPPKWALGPRNGRAPRVGRRPVITSFWAALGTKCAYNAKWGSL